MSDVQMPRLNLPDYRDKIRVRNNEDRQEIFDPVRLIWVALTPEEWVRQNMTLYISECLKISFAQFAIEAQITFNGLKKRCDTIIYDKKAIPLIIAEYKQPSVAITQKVFDQIAVYNLKLNVPYLIVSNGYNHYMCQVDRENRRYIFTDKLNYG